jgi:hypothetical protein
VLRPPATPSHELQEEEVRPYQPAQTEEEVEVDEKNMERFHGGVHFMTRAERASEM